MSERNYRAVLYQNYVSTQKPEWADNNTRESAASCEGLLKRLRGWLPRDKRAKCLDLGCGDGRFLRALRAAGYSDLSGLDLVPQAVDLARKAGLEVRQADLREYLLDSRECFDLITAFDLIEHFAKDEVLDVLQSIWKHLKPGGALIIQTPNALSPWASSLRYGDLTHEVIYSPKSLASLLRLTGFAEIETRHARPYFRGLKSVIWWPLWRAVLLGYAMWSLAETGSLLGGVYTRNMILRATKDAA